MLKKFGIRSKKKQNKINKKFSSMYRSFIILIKKKNEIMVTIISGMAGPDIKKIIKE